MEKIRARFEVLDERFAKVGGDEWMERVFDAGFFSYNLRGCGATVCQPIALLQVGDQQGYLGGPMAVADHKIFMASTDNTDGHTNVYTAALT